MLYLLFSEHEFYFELKVMLGYKWISGSPLPIPILTLVSRGGHMLRKQYSRGSSISNSTMQINSLIDLVFIPYMWLPIAIGLFTEHADHRLKSVAARSQN